jgi:hypothetical protein
MRASPDTRRTTVNDYEKAVERYERSLKNCSKARQLVEEAETEVKAAMMNLERHEEHPGIPLPEYRERAGA